MVSITIPGDYGFVLAVALGAIPVLGFVHGVVVGSFRREAKVPYPHTYATVEQCNSNPKAHKFNCAQRAHANFLENAPQTMLFTLVAGLKYPQLATTLGAAWVVCRCLFLYGYVFTDKPQGNGRKRTKLIMSSKSTLTYGARAKNHPNPLTKKLFEIAEAKKTNVTVSADVTTTKELLDLADRLGPYIAVIKTHIDILSDFSQETIDGLQNLAQKHNFLIFEDRKFIDIGNTVQKQYHGGALRISEWAHIINCAILPGEGIVEALAQTASSSSSSSDFPYGPERGLLILAEMTSKGSLATGEYTVRSAEYARKYKGFVMGFVSTRALSEVVSERGGEDAEEDFVVFTTGVNLASKGDKLGQQYQTPGSAVGRGADFIIAGRGIYAAEDPVEAAKRYREEGWEAYLARVGGK
ncbi:orotidine 5'-phosphate decarboxylase PyrG [Aspergillus rambellii]|uniref:Orotidine 5'-phosphate decarboxylase n=1 Tax=Aspergillus rambellii TaxID=308745 RepID=A0A0F8X3U0_9EURO|nr:orotidine 5'-phosphate decarboxylase PyrG [Aspergillus rambellii]